MSNKINLTKIMDAVNEKFVSGEKITTKDNRRQRPTINPDHVAMYLVRKIKNLSLPRIGMGFCRHHTTVIHAIGRVEDMMAANDEFAARVESVKVYLEERATQ